MGAWYIHQGAFGSKQQNARVRAALAIGVYYIIILIKSGFIITYNKNNLLLHIILLHMEAESPTSIQWFNDVKALSRAFLHSFDFFSPLLGGKMAAKSQASHHAQ